MSASEQERRKLEGKGEVRGLNELPLESSPYVKYSDLEDYKRQGYGTEGHMPVVETARSGGATDAPTLSGSGLSKDQVRAADAANRVSIV